MKNITLILLLIFFSSTKENDNISKIIEPSPEERGKLIFQKGDSFGKTSITALMSNIEIPATVLPCASCHGIDGKGKPEGGVTPSNITWSSLTTNYAGKRNNGRTHPAYTEKTIKKAISMGMDPAGNNLNNTMPKYKMSHQDMSDLVAYLKILGTEKERGVTNREIQIGWLPLIQNKLPTVDDAQKAIIKAYFSEINEQGGIFSRKLKLSTINPKEEKDLKRFALLGSATLTHSITTETVEIPDIPYVGISQPSDKNYRYSKQSSFFIYPNFQQQINLFLKNRTADNPLLIIKEEGILTEINLSEEAIKLRPNIKVLTKPAIENSFKNIIEQIKAEPDAKVLLLLNQSAEIQFLKELEIAKLPINIFLFGTFSKTPIFNLPSFFDNKISLIYPSWVPTKTGKGMQFFLKLQTKYQLTPKYKQSQLAALAAAKLLIDGLQLSGRGITQENFTNQLESLYKHDTNYSPPISFTKNRHTGSNQLYIIRYLGKSGGLQLVNQIGQSE